MERDLSTTMEQEIVDIPQLATQWARIRGRLQSEVGEVEYRNWLRQMTLAGVDGDEITVHLPTRFLRDWVRSRYGDRLNALWQAENPAIRRVESGSAAPRRPSPVWPRASRRPSEAGSRGPAPGPRNGWISAPNCSSIRASPSMPSWSASRTNSPMPARAASPSSRPARASIRCSSMAASDSARRI